jgi:hypothetical protein
LLKEAQPISNYLPDESEYYDLAVFLRAGGLLEIGKCLEFGSFARLRIERTTIDVATMKYKDLADVLRQMNAKARQYAEENW